MTTGAHLDRLRIHHLDLVGRFLRTGEATFSIDLVVAAVAVFVINGVLDLWLASEYYILFPESDSEKEETRQANPA